MRSTGDAAAFIQSLPRAVHLLITDPPWRIHAGNGKPQDIRDPSTLRKSELFKRAAPYALIPIPDIVQHLREVRRRMVKGAHAYVFLPSGEHFAAALQSLIDDGWTFLRLLIWDKNPHGGGGMGYTWRGAFEPIAILSNGPARAYPAGNRMFPTLLRQRPTSTRTARPPQLYRTFIDASSAPGELVIDPYCGLDPLQRAAQEPPARRWLTNDILTPAQVQAQAKAR